MPGFTLLRRLRIFVFVLYICSVKAALSQTTPSLGHVVVVAMENHSYDDIVGSSSMPYLNSLINQYGLAQNFIANVHGSFPDYAMLTTGELITQNGGGLPNDFPISIDNLVRELNAAGKTWKVYAESIPSTGYTGGDSGAYVKRHNPFAYMTDVINHSAQAGNMVSFSQFANDLAANTLPNFSFVVPNVQNDADVCPGGGTSCTDSTKLSNADQWLQVNIGPLLSNGAFQQDGLLVIWWDEGNASDTNAGGKVPITLVGPTIKPGFRSTTLYHHENLLRTIAEGLGLGFPGASVYVPGMGEFFGVATTLSLSSSMLSQQGLSGYISSQIVDGNTSTDGWHTDTATPGAWLQVDLGAGNPAAVTKLRIFPAYAGFPGNTPGTYDIQYSDDASAWSNASTGFSPNQAGWNSRSWGNAGAHRYWRLLLTNTPGPGPWLMELQLITQ